MTDKQYKKYLLQVNSGIIKMVWCKQCKQQDACDQKLKEECAIRYEKSKHKSEWSYEFGLKQAQERDKQFKDKIKEIKKQFKEGANEMKSKEEIKAILLKHFNDNLYCKDCKFYPRCGLVCGNCRPTNWQMSEDFADKLAGEIIA